MNAKPLQCLDTDNRFPLQFVHETKTLINKSAFPLNPLKFCPSPEELKTRVVLLIQNDTILERRKEIVCT